MKTVSILFLSIFYFYGAIYAQDDLYVKNMEENISGLEESGLTINDFQKSANAFERIANVKGEDWLPKYWAAYCYVRMSLMSKKNEEKDQFADKALEHLKGITVENDDVFVLKAYTAQAKLGADPSSRWMTEGNLFKQYLAKAKEMNINNPRIYLLEGTNIFYTPQNYGGGKEKAYPVLVEAEKKFAVYTLVSALHPNWGLPYTKLLLEECKSKE